MRFPAAFFGGLFLAVNAVIFAAPIPAQPVGVLPQSVYVWQRSWTEPVKESLAQHGDSFAEVAVLAAEVNWKRGQPVVIRPALDFSALRQLGRPVGLVLRIGPFPGPFAVDDARANALTAVAASLLAEARTNQLPVAELQIDFDCAEAKLAGYQLWVQALRRASSNVPLSITALPVWLKQPAFAQLAAAAGDYVLQVHSLERPTDVRASFTLCDPMKARQAVEQAARLGVPFRVALPTYGYLVAFDREGKFVGLSAEGPAQNWPEGVQLREVRADATSLAELVALWTADRPTAMRGVIWYRLPVNGDRLNWRWPTLASVLRGEAPQANVLATVRQTEPALLEIALQNQGTAKLSGKVQVILHWPAGEVVASDGLAGFSLAEGDPHELFLRADAANLDVGQTRLIGWVRFNQPTDARVEITKP